MAQSGMDLKDLFLDFTTTIDVLGEKREIPLVENGEEIYVNNNNYGEYIQACLTNRVMDRIKPQLTELMLGFFEIVPEGLLTVFDYQELELLMCGLPRIDMIDWMENTEYAGSLELVGADYPLVEWFWEIVGCFDQEMKARLLQFVTGTSGVPSSGFSALKSHDNRSQKFTITGVSVESCLYPRAHTCFNRLDLPLYETKEELEEKLNLVVTMESTGFDLE